MTAQITTLTAVLVLVLGLSGCGSESTAEPDPSLPASQSSANGYGASPSIKVASIEIVEGDAPDGSVSMNVSLDFDASTSLVVDYFTADGSARAPEDFSRAKGRLVFKPGETTKTIDLNIVGDTIGEQDEEFFVQFSSSDASVQTPQATVAIKDDDPQSGLASRPSNPFCIAPDAPTVTAGINEKRVFNSAGDSTKPVAMVQAPDDSSRWYLAEQDGMVYRFENVASPPPREAVIDLTSVVNSSFGEGGLLGIAFHPNFQNNGYVYLSYTVTGPNASFPLTSKLSRFESQDNGLTINPASEAALLSLDQPFSFHNGGHIVFGPDGYLYMGLGDGGGDAATYGNRSQNTKTLFGSVLRLDVDGGAPYGIPGDNPFAENPLCDVSIGAAESPAACPEIYAWGFRNPWRFSFDRETGKLWLGDVGQNDYEEVNIVEAGGNYGWNVLEGDSCFEPAVGCDATGLIEPEIVYDHNIGGSITGGFVYRGNDIPELYGRYFFVDFVTRVIFASVSNPDGTYGYEVLLNSNLSLSSLSEDENGEIYGLRYGNGRIHKFIQGTGVSNNTIPDNLIDTGCVDPGNPQVAGSGLIPYEPVATFWSDGATKERYYAIPDATTIDLDASGDWLFPNGTVLMKNFRLGGALIETRLFMRHTNGEWGGYTYEWNDTETEALRVIGGKTRDVAGQTWIYPSETQCLICHTDVANSSLGVENLQLNKDLTYPSSGMTGNQLTTADSIDVLSAPLPDAADHLPSLTDPTDVNSALEDRARAYLHTNCSGCHQPSGPTPANIDLRFETPFSSTNMCDVVPGSGDLGIVDARIIAPGDSARSILVNRVARRDVHGMPPLASNEVDAFGVGLLSGWVDGLAVCP